MCVVSLCLHLNHDANYTNIILTGMYTLMSHYSIEHSSVLPHIIIILYVGILPTVESDLLDITDYLLSLGETHIYNLGLALGLSQLRLRGLMKSNMFLDDVIAGWLRREDDVMKKGDPTWETLVKALRHPRVRQDGIAHDIAKKMHIE